MFREKNIIGLLSFVLISFQASYAADSEEDIQSTLTDSAICHRASQLQEARHVVKLEVDFPLFYRVKKTIFTGSAVCIAEGREFLTNAHCFEPWCDNQGRLKYPLYVNAEGKGRYKIADTQIHGRFFSENAPRKFAYDIAYFRIEEPIDGLEGIEPTYIEPTSLTGKDLDVVGYGSNGDVGAWFSRCDGHKRAVISPIDSLWSITQTETVTHISLRFGCQVKYDIKDPLHPIESVTPIPLKAYQGGYRPGMSGGGVFREGQYVAIPSFFGYTTPSWLARTRMYLKGKVFKGLAALGVPVPFMHSAIGDMEAHLVLKPHMNWITEARQKSRAQD